MKTILVVDDEPLAAEEIAEALEAAGLHAIWSSDPVDVLARAADPRVALLVTDLRMPQLGGLELIERARQARPDLHFILVSGHIPAVPESGKTDRPVLAVIRKPIDMTVLISAIQGALS